MSDEDATPMILSILEPDLSSAASTAARLERLSEVRRTMTIADLVPDRQPEKLEVLDELSVLLGPTLLQQPPREAPADPASTLVAVDRLAQSLDLLEPRVSRPDADAVRRLLDSVRAFRAHIETVGEAEQERLLRLLERNLLGGLPPTLRIAQCGNHR